MHLRNNTLLQGGKYKIVRFIASGGFGCTYEARHTLLDSRVALKEFFVSDFCNRDEKTGQVTVGTLSKAEFVDKLKKKFMDEARALFKMKHPGIVRVTDIFEENGTAYYAMEYIEGKSLSDVVKERGKLSEKEAVGYIRQVAEALEYVHSLNRLHLDIKPGNIMLNTEGKAILIDFGASKHYDDETGENTSTLLGINTKGYAPVEQVNQSFKSFSPATDIYALGATLYKLLTGITPPPSTLLQSEEETLKPLPSSISQPTRNAVKAAMQLLRRKRPQQVREWTALLNATSSSEPQEQTVIDAQPQPTSKPKPVPTPIPTPESDPEQTPNPHPKWSTKWIYIIAAVVAIIVLIVGINRNAVEKTDDTGSQISDTIPEVEDILAVDTLVEDILGEPSNGTINGHEYVDLGLSVKWATCNVGASSPSDYGDYFAWGETSPKSEYTKANSKTYEKSMGDVAGSYQYDAARANWGSTWRLPTKKECQELVDKCTWTWTSEGGHNGYRVSSKTNRNSIFLPAAGWRCVTSLNKDGECGYYWSSTPSEGGAQDAYYLYFDSSHHGVNWYNRNVGFSVRPVSD